MKTFSISLLQELENKLNDIQKEDNNPILQAKKGESLSRESLQKLKTHFKKHIFQNKKEEINFFKEIKPQFESKIMYYNEIYNIEISKPKGTPKTIRKHYKNHLQKIKTYFKENIEFYKYYRSENSELDKIYFFRKRNKLTHVSNDNQHKYNSKFTTSHDYKVAKIKANEKIQDYIEFKLKKTENTEPHSSNKIKNVKWTGSKVALVELMYALQTEGVLNNGELSLTEIALHFETIFNLEIGQFHRTFLEIRTRKSERTKFLNALKEKLIQRMNDADEN